MARGWESKSVEAQTEEAAARRSARTTHYRRQPKPDDQQERDLIVRRESILLSRVRVVRELENAQNPRYKAQLSKALADLDAQLSACTQPN